MVLIAFFVQNLARILGPEVLKIDAGPVNKDFVLSSSHLTHSTEK